MHPMLNIAVNAARAGGNTILRYIDRIDDLSIENKQRNDFVTEVDRQTEEEIIKVLRKAYPEHSILAEESGLTEGNEYQWIIDPLDGTTNYLHGFPQFAVSIALRYNDKIEQAVVFDPMRQEIFSASRGKGAQLNNRRIRVTPRRSLEGSLIGTGFPFRHPQHLDNYLAMFKALSGQVADMRRPGSAALDLAYVAAGRLDGFWEIGLNNWDMAAGALLIQEAGGLVGDFSGGKTYLESGNIVAGTPKVYSALLRNIDPHRGEYLQR
ncbi:inositol monophosphatase [Solemya pervernicosa gill symbiont]|uniref:Inositol-1-monophosphatase n=2 Tax=Gammaproteobacteria incertae sedis TaxID=118884 RepID=A0A1T2LAR7_9GAMM|nr:inositol-1-monophosphatase [Candidatus Reidiella endopervernicosa]OOZ42181.1 inositol monophosphatase [Solemya pervernicosa gill symbiont]QKQ27250.1 inositol-1-monophosphatase [Candidatus Reidiella endopervernicosa]